MKPSWKYFTLTLKHKWYVYLAGRKLGVGFFRLLVHDWTKFLPSELPHYGRQFFGDGKDSLGFGLCWARHQNRHEHHWEYWVPRSGHVRGGLADGAPLPMSEQAAREMVADWMGAGRAYAGEWPDPANWTWVHENLPKMTLDSSTKENIGYIIAALIVLEEG